MATSMEEIQREQTSGGQGDVRRDERRVGQDRGRERDEGEGHEARGRAEALARPAEDDDEQGHGEDEERRGAAEEERAGVVRRGFPQPEQRQGLDVVAQRWMQARRVARPVVADQDRAARSEVMALVAGGVLAPDAAQGERHEGDRQRGGRGLDPGRALSHCIPGAIT
jgi:hypothetical protein